MSAGRAEFLWKDPNNPLYKKATKVSAPTYIALSLAAIDETVSDPKVFPLDEGAKFPRTFIPTVKIIFKRIIRIYSHLYCAHSADIKANGCSPHLNSLFKHFVYFSREFDLLDKAEEAPLASLINRMFANDQDAHQR